MKHPGYAQVYKNQLQKRAALYDVHQVLNLPTIANHCSPLLTIAHHC